MSMNASRALDLPTRGTVKARTIENARLDDQRAEASRRQAKQRLADRRAAAARADRSERATSPSGARSLGRQLAADHGWAAAQFTCLDSLWTNESGWQMHAQNSSGAYGIPQALPGTRMSTAGSDWRNSASTQIRWGLDYIDARYGSPCGAWQYWRANHWY
jgi:resuscitation-promoting factor RpfB